MRYLLLLIPLCLSGCSFAMVKPLPEKQTTDIGGSKLEYAVGGEGWPVIVLLSGYGADMDTSWSKSFPKLKTISTVFAYNRFNYGNSGWVDEPQTGTKIIAALRNLLREKDLNPPYVLVGHSLGGVYAQLFARLYWDEISGVVLVDSSHPDQEKMRKAHEGAFRRAFSDTIYWFDSVFHPRRHTEIEMFAETVKEIKDAPPFPDIPLVVVSAGEKSTWLVSDDFARILEQNQRSLAALSPQGKHIIVKQSGHFVQNDEPEVVVEAIREVVDKARESNCGC
jgi:pimeloyl-ACP methyl ester carboxylesterase